MGRILLASNRLPITIELADRGPNFIDSVGGLATGLRALHESGKTRWFGWPGLSMSTLPASKRAVLDDAFAASRLRPVEVAPEEVKLYYDAFANGALWPLLHYLTGDLPLRVEGWDEYVAVNERFADMIAAEHKRGDLVWVHDYHLMLLPQLLRRRVPDARIGFFLHVPFPSSDVFRAAPHREALLAGMLGADLVGFHTAAYVRHFATSCVRLLGAQTDLDRVRFQDRVVRIGMFPMGVDTESFAALAEDPAVVEEAVALRGRDGCAILVGIDRLDYTKGIPRRLLAFEQLLRKHPELHGKVRLVQLAVPTRGDGAAYKEFRSLVDTIVGRILGAFATPTWVPVHYMHRAVSRREVVAMYRAADVMLVTPIRDGMNLVAKEFVASRTDGDGVLVLSELAGAASELAEAVSVNPYDVDDMAEAFFAALAMPPDDRRRRMQAMRARVKAHGGDRWTEGFLAALEAADDTRPVSAPSETIPLADAVSAAAGAQRTLIILDYDGTLVPFAPRPEEALPDAELMSLLRSLSDHASTDVHIVSGRRPGTLEEFFGGLRVSLHAEHGAWSKLHGHGTWWRRASTLPGLEALRALLSHYAERTPGALLEEKTTTIAWHWRMADPIFGARQAADLRLHLAELLSNAPVEVLVGDKVIEVRRNDVHKGRVVDSIVASASDDVGIICAGDDRTDEDMFTHLPPSAVSIHVGDKQTAARFRVSSPHELRRLLAGLVAS